MNESAAGKPATFGIAEAARLAGVSKQTVEYYILVGLIAPIRRGRSRRRAFNRKHVRRIRLIRELNETGLPLREIRDTYRLPR